jgi:hypothetical protein
MDEHEQQIRPARINWADLAMSVATFAKGIAMAAHDALEIIEISLAAHSQEIMERQAFRRDAGRAIETLTKEVGD